MQDMFEVIEDATADLFSTHTHTCVECGASYQTCNPKTGGRCSRCLVVRSGSPELVTIAHITCRVCDRTATVGLGHPALLCQGCMEDLEATRTRVQTWLEAALAQLEENQALWNDTKAGSVHWPAIQAALIAVAEKRARQEDLDRTWAKRKAEGGALGRLLDAYEAYAHEADRLATELERLSRAQAEINTAFLATEI